MSADVATLEGTPATLSDEALEGLQAQLRGTASANGDGAGREVFKAMHNPQPGLTVQASGTADVVDAVNFARQQGLAMAIRGGGHSLAGLSTIDGVGVTLLGHFAAGQGRHKPRGPAEIARWSTWALALRP